MSGHGSEREVAEYACGKNAVLEKDAVELLAGVGDFRGIIDNLLGEGEFLISADKVRGKIASGETGGGASVEIKRPSFKAIAKEIEPNCKVLKEYDVTGQSSSTGKVDDFLRWFTDKYEALAKILRKRQNFSPKDIARAMGAQDGSEVELIAMVFKRWKTKQGNEALLLDDPTGDCIGVVGKQNRQLTEYAKRLLLDDVVGIRGRKIGHGMIGISEIIRPDIENRPPKPPERDLSVAVISDMHVGSKLFLEAEFDRFLSWIGGGMASGSEAERIGKIKYLVICGDNVDGIGVYPNQYDELAIKDLFEQYDEFSRKIAQLPEYIEVFICPGQHDAVRRADPQPAIPKEYVRELAGLRNIHFVGSPSWLEIEGLKCMVYHGASLHDLYTSVDFLSNERPQEAMVELLKRRDLMTGYGQKQPYVPETKDFMVIREQPDFYFGGDMHHNGYQLYRSCLVVNAGTWQKQTNYQIEQGHVPTPGIVAEIALKDRSIRETRFWGDA